MYARIVSQFTRISAIGLLTSLAGCAGGGGPEGGGGFQMPPMPVEAAPVTREVIVDGFSALGTIEAINAIQIVSEIDGKVTALPFSEGAAVSAGTIIAQLDDDQLRAERDRAEAIRNQRELTHARVKSIVDQRAGSKQDLDDAYAALKVSEAEFALAESRLSKARLTAPFPGMVGARQVSIGEFVRGGDPITELAQIDKLKVTFSAPERFLAKLKLGSAVTVSSPAFPDRALTGEIDVIEPVVQMSTRSVKVTARLDNPERLFRPGMSANVNVTLSRRDGALAIPSDAVFAEGDGMFVFVIGADGSVAQTPVTLGSRTSALVEIISGLEAGQQVVKAGHQKLFPGAKVMTGPPPGMGGDPTMGGAGAPSAPDSSPMPTDSAAGVDSL